MMNHILTLVMCLLGRLFFEESGRVKKEIVAGSLESPTSASQSPSALKI